MAKKMTKEERRSWEKDLATLRAAVSQCEQVLKDDDAAEDGENEKAARGLVGKVASSASGRQGNVLGILAARELPRRGGPPE
jgi:hypothetical protein